MIDHDGAWLTSVKVGLPLLILGILVCVVAIYAIRVTMDDDREGFWVFGIVPMLALSGLLIAPAFGYWPYSADYHRLQPATGTVRTIDSRFLGASQYVVVTYDTGLIVRCDDSRCATVRPGDTLRLLCTKEHEFGSPMAADGWGCRWGQL